MTKQILTQEELKKHLHYDPLTGIFTWIKVNSLRVKIGQIAGSIQKIGYVIIGVNGIRYYAHRLACLYMTGEFPNKVIDHKDENKSNNKWENLRQCSQSQNMLNRGRQLNNKSGFKGVHEDARKVKTRWIAKCKIKGIVYNLGGYPTPEIAHKVYRDFIKEHEPHFIHE
jgi:hypothetical protein